MLREMGWKQSRIRTWAVSPFLPCIKTFLISLLPTSPDILFYCQKTTQFPILEPSAHQFFPLTYRAIMDRISKFNLVHRFEKRTLLVAINCVAAISIFFFGYDQGVVGYVSSTLVTAHIGP